jgi:hypothetical protein
MTYETGIGTVRKEIKVVFLATAAPPVRDSCRSLGWKRRSEERLEYSRPASVNISSWWPSEGKAARWTGIIVERGRTGDKSGRIAPI